MDPSPLLGLSSRLPTTRALPLTPSGLKSQSGEGNQSASEGLRLATAAIPFNYISDPRQRIEIYRKIAQLADKSGLNELQKELRDRFGSLPPAMELLLQVAELKIMAAERAITVIEVKESKVMLTRNNDYVMVGTKFPRLTKQTASARLKEIKKLLLAL